MQNVGHGRRHRANDQLPTLGVTLPQQGRRVAHPERRPLGFAVEAGIGEAGQGTPITPMQQDAAPGTKEANEGETFRGQRPHHDGQSWHSRIGRGAIVPTNVRHWRCKIGRRVALVLVVEVERSTCSINNKRNCAFARLRRVRWAEHGRLSRRAPVQVCLLSDAPPSNPCKKRGSASKEGRENFLTRPQLKRTTAALRMLLRNAAAVGPRRRHDARARVSLDPLYRRQAGTDGPREHIRRV